MYLRVNHPLFICFTSECAGLHLLFYSVIYAGFQVETFQPCLALAPFLRSIFILSPKAWGVRVRLLPSNWFVILFRSLLALSCVLLTLAILAQRTSFMCQEVWCAHGSNQQSYSSLFLLVLSGTFEAPSQTLPSRRKGSGLRDYLKATNRATRGHYRPKARGHYGSCLRFFHWFFLLAVLREFVHFPYRLGLTPPDFPLFSISILILYIAINEKSRSFWSNT